MVGGDSLFECVQGLLDSQLLAVLATQREGEPYTSLVGFLHSDDLRDLYFVTARSTRKYGNILADGRASMMIDNRGQGAADFERATAATAVGAVHEVEGRERQEVVDRYLGKFPFLADFVRAPSCAVMRLEVSRYIVVSRFQHVLELHVRR